MRPSEGPWDLWCNLTEQGAVRWTVNLMRDGRWVEKRIQVDPQADGWFDVQLVLDPRELPLEIHGNQRG